MRAVCVTMRDPFRPAAHRSVDVVRRRRRIRALAPKIKQPFIALLNGRAVLRKEWSRKLRDGDILAFVALPQGGDGGSNPIAAILMIAVAIFAPYAASALLGTEFGAIAATALGGTTTFLSVATAAIGIVGAMLVNALIPPPMPPKAASMADLAAGSPTYSLGAQGNSARIGQPIPEIFGRHIIYPDFAAMPYTEYSGNEQYLYQLFCIGRGEYDIEQTRIEDTLLSNYEEVQTQVVGPGGTVTLFPTRVITSSEVSGQELAYNVAEGPFVANPAETQTDALGFDVVLPRGLYYANDSGGLDPQTLTFRFEAQAIDESGTPTGSWVVLGNETITAKTTTGIRRSYRYSVTLGRYQCRATRTSTKSTDTRVGNDLAWGGMRAYIPGSQSYGDVTILAMRIRATDNISQQASRKVNLIVTRRLPTWTGSSWTSPMATRNPAWAIAYMARERLADSRINLAALKTLADTAAARGDTFDGVLDSQSTVWEALSMAGRAVRAVPYMQGGALQVMRDEAAPLPVAMFSPRNMVRNSLSLQYKMASEEMADAVDIEYYDSATWSWKTVRAALAGSSESTVYRFRLFGCTSRAQAWREGMHMAACNRYRRRFVTFQTEMEGFIPSLGDPIAITHDMPQWGQWGEAVAFDEVTRRMTVTEPLDFSAGGTHYVSLRKRNGEPAGPFVAVATADPHIIELSDWVMGSDIDPDVGQGRERTHIAFGPATSRYIVARVLSVRPRSMRTAQIEAVIESDYVHAADTGAAPSGSAWQLPTRQTYPVVAGLIAKSMVGNVDQMIVSWQPAAGADRYLIEQSADGETWTRSGEVSAASFTGQALYGSATQIRVAAVGLTRGPWAAVAYAVGSDYMWSGDANPMWSSDSNLMWST